MPRFVIDLGDIEMSKDDQRALSGALQKTALGHIAGMKFEKPFAVKFPWEWLGLILRRDFEDILRVEQHIGERLAETAIGKTR